MLRFFRCLTTGLGLVGLTACAVNPLTPTPLPTQTRAPVAVVQVAFTPTLTQVGQPVLTATPIVIATTETLLPTEAVAGVGLPVPTSEAVVANPVVPTSAAIALPPTETVVPSVVVAPPPSADVAAAEQYCIDWINSERMAAGVGALLRDETLMSIARARVADMAARGYTGHNDPVTGVALGRAMMQAAGYTSTFLGENWYGTISGPPEIVDVAMTWFMTDPPHYRNILSPNYVGVGVGIGFNGRQWLLVQNFAGQ